MMKMKKAAWIILLLMTDSIKKKRYVCMFVCMFVCMYICVYVCMYVRMHACMCVYVCLYVSMFVCMFVCMSSIRVDKFFSAVYYTVTRPVARAVCVYV